ncbi:MAG: FAD-binding domain-containing protein [Phycisphaerae bacterium]
MPQLRLGMAGYATSPAPASDASRTTLVDSLRSRFAFAAEVDDHIPETRGGRAAALRQLRAINPAAYGRTRNHLDGDATRLSAHIRHGVLSLAEVKHAALARVNHPRDAEKLLSELGWRDYYQRVYDVIGDGVWNNIEGWKTGRRDGDYQPHLPDDIRHGRTGIDYIDHFAQQLTETGYLHNHARMWLAAYVVHGRGVHWKAGAAWFLEHLLDGDPASNNLSWQWVASTFSHKPYFFNRENLQKYAAGRFAPHQKQDPFDDSYENLAARLFPDPPPDATPEDDAELQASLKVDAARFNPPRRDGPPVGKALAFVHHDRLSPENPALQAAGQGVFVWDVPYLRESRHSLKRLVFQAEFLAEMPEVEDATAEDGDVAAAVLAAARARNATHILTTPTPDPLLKRTLKTLAESMPVHYAADEPFVELNGSLDLRRFSRFWKKAQKALWNPHGS